MKVIIILMLIGMLSLVLGLHLLKFIGGLVAGIAGFVAGIIGAVIALVAAVLGVVFGAGLLGIFAPLLLVALVVGAVVLLVKIF